jgi:hypothetical protein
MLQFLQSSVASFSSWLKSVYSEADGSGSSTRVHIGLFTGFVIAVGMSFAWLVHRQHLTIEQFDNFLSAGSGFIVVTCGPLYAANKIADVRNNANAANQNQQSTQQGQ